ncbi:hypothetical protein NSK_000229 [Nannochloropsis salina CCMP1776]|uniref:Mannosyltransferase n=1 Tax=Nannochloropsis salina CCMP1776 TaxID=1027361 RepID=A0A4D9DB14_9STRA|nr:hypothetical protein NSK_000229 [Nannochloropsis salina CCMP1776]|eukprot:TFJ88660.1 hypothetical protein NSK_000229 [Nannochloropsis salina CCMP1776]
MSKLNSPGVASFLLFLALFAYRVLNAWTVKTYFNPDEYWQGPEVAHKLVFGSGLLTWEWESERIRSFIHPLLFAVFYALLKVTNLASRGAVAYGPSMVVQAFLTASTDLHVYWLAKRVMMQGSGDGDDAIARAETIARCALFCQCSNWFMWYAGVRTFSSSLEMALLVPAVYHWVALVERAESIEGGNQKSLRYLPPSRVGMTEPLSIVLGTVSIMVRPTALFAWVPLGFWRLSCTRLYDIPQYLLRVVLFWTALVMLVSTLLDSYCYNRVSLLDQARNAGPGAHPTVSTVPQWEWVFTPVNFLRINLVAGVAVQYGSHPFHWYFTLGALTVLTTQLPFVLLGLRRALSRNRFSVWSPFSVVDFRPTALCLLALVVLTYPLGLSLSPHKEFRFLLPVLPFAHVLAGVVISEQVMFPRHEIVARSCSVAETKISAAPRTWRGGRKPRFFLLSILFLATTHAPMAFYFSRIHQRGPIDVMQFLSSLLAEDAKGMGRGATRETGQHEGSIWTARQCSAPTRLGRTQPKHSSSTP